MLLPRIQRWVPLAVWTVAILTLFLVPLKIIGYGYLPTDDALRHAAKAVSGKPWSDILVMRGEFALDHNPGWHAILGTLHRWQGWDTDALVSFSVAALLILFGLAGLSWLRRPEAWLAALLTSVVFFPEMLGRYAYGRPFIFTVAVLVTILFAWSGHEDDRPPWPMLLLTTVLIGAATWIHGTWYLFALPVTAFALGGLWRRSLWLALCWVSGAVTGALLTGHPWQYLSQALTIVLNAFGHHTLQRMLVKEFAPSDGAPLALVALALVLIWRRLSPAWTPASLRSPVLILAALSWLLGFKVLRFWLDWGLPALVVWLALAFQEQLALTVPANSCRRLLLTVGLAAGCLFGVTSDRDSRWTSNLMQERLSADDPAVAPWLPEEGGIVYNAEMSVFYRLFFSNPQGNWKYMLGFEPSFMPPEDLAILRKIQWNFGDPRAFEPWVANMRPSDRMILSSAASSNPGGPGIKGLEWKYAATGLWIGRLPKPSSLPAPPQP